MKPTITLMLAALLALAGCHTHWETTEVTVTREFELPPGTSFSVEAGEGDEALSTVTVPEGHRHAGTYTTTSPHLHAPLRDSMTMMGKPGVKVTIEVSEENEILTVSNEVTMQ